jgi:hypothetical protein
MGLAGIGSEFPAEYDLSENCIKYLYISVAILRGKHTLPRMRPPPRSRRELLHQKSPRQSQVHLKSPHIQTSPQ